MSGSPCSRNGRDGRLRRRSRRTSSRGSSAPGRRTDRISLRSRSTDSGRSRIPASNGKASGHRARSNLGLEARQAFRQRLDSQIGLGARQARAGDLEHQASVGRVAHLERGVIQNSKHACQAIGIVKRLGLFIEHCQLIGAVLEKLRSSARDAHHIDIAHVRHQVARQLQEIIALVYLRADKPEQRHHITLRNRMRKVGQDASCHLAQKRAGITRAHCARAENAQLLERAQGVAHTASCMTCHDTNGLVVVLETLLLAHVTKAPFDILIPDAMKIKALAARKNRFENLLGIGGAQHEDHVCGRLFEGLQQRVERRRGKHVHLVDDIDLVLATYRSEINRIDDLFTHIVDAGTTCGVELIHIRMVALGDKLTFLTGAIGHTSRGSGRAGRIGLMAEQRLGKNTSHGRLARSARAAKQIRMRQAPFGDSMLQRRDDVLLTHNGVEGQRAVFPIERFHAAPIKTNVS